MPGDDDTSRPPRTFSALPTACQPLDRSPLIPRSCSPSHPTHKADHYSTGFALKGEFRIRLLRLGVERLLKSNTELFPERLQLLQVLLVLALVLNLRLDAYDARSA